jgi:hypothetical protein
MVEQRPSKSEVIGSSPIPGVLLLSLIGKTPACRAAKYGFESRSDRYFIRRSSMVEHLTENQRVKSSILFVVKSSVSSVGRATDF